MTALRIEVQDADRRTYERILVKGARFVPSMKEIMDMLETLGIEYKQLTVKVTFSFDVGE